jgi:hypothetical protein
MLEGDSILSPERLGDDEPERLAAERMKRVRDLDQRWISGAGCSRQLSRRPKWRPVC